jgi:TonB family protein
MNFKSFSFKTLALFLGVTMLLLSNGFAQNKSQLSACEEQELIKQAQQAKAEAGKSDVKEEGKPEPALTITLTNVADPEKNLVQSSKIAITDTKFTSEDEVEIANAETPYYWPSEKAVYIDGNQELFNTLAKKIKYPNELYKDKVQGIVVVQIIVEKDGSITNPKVVAPVHQKLDAEALRVMTELKCFKPAKQDGEVVRSYLDIPVPFLLDVKK